LRKESSQPFEALKVSNLNIFATFIAFALIIDPEIGIL